MNQIKFKYWIEADGKKFYGPGPHELLEKIQTLGSLSKAAKEMQMSYKKAWEMVQRLNKYADDPLVIMKKGGATGGGAEITPCGLAIMNAYSIFQKKIKTLINKEKVLLAFLK
ncbi:molybdate transport system regulatory protein [Pedobacter sp. UYEF25]